MCRLLVMARSSTHPDAVIAARDCYQRGDIVRVEPDSHVFGAMEGPPTFAVVDLPDVPVAEYLHAQDAATLAERVPAAVLRVPALARGARSLDRDPVRRRRYWFDLDAGMLRDKRRPTDAVDPQ